MLLAIQSFEHHRIELTINSNIILKPKIWYLYKKSILFILLTVFLNLLDSQLDVIYGYNVHDFWTFTCSLIAKTLCGSMWNQSVQVCAVCFLSYLFADSQRILLVNYVNSRFVFHIHFALSSGTSDGARFLQLKLNT